MNTKIIIVVLLSLSGLCAMAQEGNKVRGLTTKDSVLFAHRIDSLWAALNGRGNNNGSDSGAANTAVNIKWFNPNIGDSITPAIDAFNAAKAFLAPKGGGTIYCPAGKYPAVDVNGWLIGQSKIKLIGDGQGLTVLLPAAGTTAGGLQMAPYRDIGWKTNTDSLYTYEDSAAIGQDYIPLKAGQDLSALKVGMILFLNDGGSYYDQHYGEPVMIYKIQGNRIYLKDQLSRDYSVARGSWLGLLTQPFTIPPVGQSAVAYMSGPPANAGTKISVSINNNLFNVVSFTDTSAILKNVGKGNATGGILPVGAQVMKWRALALAPTMVHDVTVENLTVVGRRKALIVSNSYNTYFHNVQFKWLPASDGGGGTIDGDDGRNATLDHCSVEAPYYFTSQLSRSFVGFKAVYTTFHNSSIDFTEFATGEIANCTFEEGREIDSIDNYPNNAAITIGASAADVNIHHNTFRISNRGSAISSQPDIQVYVGQSGNGITIDHNNIYCNNCKSAIDLTRNGAITISNNNIFGSLDYLFNVDGQRYSDSSNQRTRNSNWFGYINTCKIINNTFGGYIDAVSNRIWHNVEFTGNDINRFDNQSNTLANSAVALGNVIRGSTTDTIPIQRLIVKNNTFRHWSLNNTSFKLPASGIDSLRMDISLNYFYDNTGTGAKDSIVTVFTPYDNRYNKGGGSGSAGGGYTPSNFIFGEAPTGTRNSSNTTFTLANTPNTNKEIIYVNGVRQKRGTDYTLTGSTLTLTIAPRATDDLSTDYIFGSLTTNFMVGEVPGGSRNGSNTAFTVANTPATGKETLYVNGVRQKRGVDYTITGTTITMTIAPRATDDLLTDYIY